MRSLREKAHRKTELLSPAGSYDSARAAVNAGADAIYMGGPLFSARAFAESSGEDMLLQTLDFCHLRGVKVYMTLNTLLKDAELCEVRDYLKPYVDKRLDGVIIQDLGVFRLVREWYPELELHVSTQAAVTGARTAAAYLKQGAKRIVLARELSLSEIRDIKEKTGAELEVFAHGALCYSYSGNCLMSSFIGGRSGNRGKCAGTCRLPFEVCDSTGHPQGRKEERYCLSMCDLNTLRRLPEMIEAGVYSFKIEGRMKSPVYTAAVTSVYRKYLDLAEKYVENEAAQVSNAAEGTDIQRTNIQRTDYKSNHIDNIESDCKQNRTLQNRRSDTTIYRVESEDERLLSEVFDRSGTTDGYLDGRNGRSMLTLLEKPEYRNRDETLIDKLKAEYIDKDSLLPIKIEANLRCGSPIELVYSYGDISVRKMSELKVQEAGKRPTSEAEIADKICRLGGTDFEAEACVINMDDNCFVPMSALNELRREAADELRRQILENY